MIVNELKRILKICSISSSIAVINFDNKTAAISAGQIFIKFCVNTEECDKRGVMFSCSDIKLSALRGVKSVFFSSSGETWEMYNSETGAQLLSGNCPELPSPVPASGDTPRVVGAVSTSAMKELMAVKAKTSFPVFLYGQRDALVTMYMDPICCQLYRVSAVGKTTPFSVGFDKKTIEMAVKIMSGLPEGDWSISLFKWWNLPFASMSANGFEIFVPCVQKKAPAIGNFIKGISAPKINIKLPSDMEGERICINTYDGSVNMAKVESKSNDNEHIVSAKAIMAIPFISDGAELTVSSSGGYVFINDIGKENVLRCAVIGQY